MEWKTVKLGEVCEILDNKRIPLSAMQRERMQGQYPYYGAQGVIDHIDKYLFDEELLLVAEDGANLETRNEDIAQIARGKYWVNNHAHILKGNGRISLNLLAYMLNHTDIQSYITGSAQPKLNQANLVKIELDIPDEDSQRRIAAILSSLDAQIENNNRINANLEAQAQALFKSWFVDFEPWGGKMPEGWREGNIFDIADILDKKRKPLSSNERDKMKKVYPYYGATSRMDYVEDYLFDGNYTLLGEDGSVIREDGTPYVQYVWGKLWVNNHAHVLQGKNGYSTEMLHTMLSQLNIAPLITGAVQAKLNQGNMQKIKVVIATDEVMQNASKMICPLYAQIRNNTESSSRLAALRDTLLPKLMKGEIEV